MLTLLRSLWLGLLSDLGLRRTSQRIFSHDEEILQAVRDLANREQLSDDEVTAQLLSQVLTRTQENERLLHCWHSLSEREQQVAALTSLGYTNRQMAAKLGIAVSTVATHMRNVLYKFDLHSKAELRQALSGWDFSAWEDTR